MLQLWSLVKCEKPYECFQSACVGVYSSFSSFVPACVLVWGVRVVCACVCACVWGEGGGVSVCACM